MQLRALHEGKASAARRAQDAVVAELQAEAAGLKLRLAAVTSGVGRHDGARAPPPPPPAAGSSRLGKVAAPARSGGSSVKTAGGAGSATASARSRWVFDASDSDNDDDNDDNGNDDNDDDNDGVGNDDDDGAATILAITPVKVVATAAPVPSSPPSPPAVTVAKAAAAATAATTVAAGNGKRDALWRRLDAGEAVVAVPHGGGGTPSKYARTGGVTAAPQRTSLAAAPTANVRPPPPPPRRSSGSLPPAWASPPAPRGGFDADEWTAVTMDTRTSGGAGSVTGAGGSVWLPASATVRGRATPGLGGDTIASLSAAASATATAVPSRTTTTSRPAASTKAGRGKR